MHLKQAHLNYLLELLTVYGVIRTPSNDPCGSAEDKASALHELRGLDCFVNVDEDRGQT